MNKEIMLNEQPAALRVSAKIISYIFHPLFIPTYIFIWLVLRFPYTFSDITPQSLLFKKISVFFTTAFLPALSVFLLWRLRFIENMYLRTQKERIIPYVIIMIFYWWMWYLSKNFSDQPAVLKFFFFGIFLTSIAGLTINNFIKISMHAMGMGGALTFIVLTCLFYSSYLGADLAVCTLVTGLVCSARLIINEHSGTEIYAGIFVSAICQGMAYFIFM
jgi:hypothetical protein